ncbi:hypothetical protein J3R30DRAFT_3300280 [Lentinula aciculospora]|uniref:Chromatin modification-related protein n=1 Tax=Lentinula aciculospora TaxID=153920 RepID=A0A9W9DHL3_9AGAR|nr:hypothetical protein J3R30DRAFT_3300280 [Lentinula aciculospora]
MSVSAQSLEDAANIATEFIYSLDNIPNEIKHILEEITHKESRVQELQHQIDSDSARWVRYSLRGANTSAGSSPSLLYPSKPIAHLPAKIKQSYAEIEQLSAEKLALAERVVDLINRTYTRLGVDLSRSRALQGELSTEVTRGMSMSASPSLSGAIPAAYQTTALTDSLKQALHPGQMTEIRSAVVNTPAAGPPPKMSASIERKVTASASIKLPPSRSISPAAPATKSASHTRSRLSRQTHPPPRHTKIEETEEDEDEEPEIEAADGDDEDDDHKLYCFCQKPSAGDMIACDNSGCPYEWFHLECVGITEPPPDTTKWYCPHCINKVTARKGRKKSAS